MKIRRLLIANRGEIARRIIRSAHAMGIATVAVYSDADAESLHVREATLAQSLGGLSAADSYLRIDKLIAAAQASGADAVHPGYGFLSENAEFADAVLAAGLIWVGPPPAAIRALGNKAGAKQLAQAHGVPCLPGYQGADQSDARFAEEAGRIGYPLMVKATAGGGGRGMRLVLRAEDLAAALLSARSEAQSSFGSAELLIERALLAPRHVEVQVFADAMGHCIHLGERDCSVQRRHQKLIEESPSPAVDAALCERMGRCAVELAQAAGYVGAGTVEFLLEESNGQAEFFLMEMNTRLQVEHPVTELRTGLDLVEWQLRVAQGEPLPLTQEQVHFSGHAIEVRLCAEDEEFRPQAGRILQLALPESLVRCDHAMREGGVVSPYYDSMLGKLIAHAPNRTQAIDRLVAALDQTVVLGLPSNRALLRAALNHAAFRAGEARIPFLAEHGAALREVLQKEELKTLIPCGCSPYLAHIPAKTTRLAAPFDRPLRLRHRGEFLDFALRELGQGRVQLTFHGETREAEVWPDGEGALVLNLGGQRQRIRLCQPQTGHWHVQMGGTELWLEQASFAPTRRAGQGSGADELRAPFNGRLLRIAVLPGQSVTRGEPLATLESMKLEHALSAPREAVVKAVLVEAGQQLSTGQLVLTLESGAEHAKPH